MTPAFTRLDRKEAPPPGLAAGSSLTPAMGGQGGRLPASGPAWETRVEFRRLPGPLRAGASLRGERLRSGGAGRSGPRGRVDDAEGGPWGQAQRQQRAGQVSRPEAPFGDALQEAAGGRELRVLGQEEPLDTLQGGVGREAPAERHPAGQADLGGKRERGEGKRMRERE